MLRSGNRYKSEEHRTGHGRTKVINYQNMNQQKNAVREGVIKRNKKLMLIFRRDWASSTSHSHGRCSHKLVLTVHCWKENLLFQGSKVQEGSIGKAGEKCGEYSDLQGSWHRVNTTAPPPFSKNGYRYSLQENWNNTIREWLRRKHCLEVTLSKPQSPRTIAKVYSIFFPPWELNTIGQNIILRCVN